MKKNQSSIIIIGVMGPGEGATEKDIEIACELGKAIAREAWIVLSGGRNVGVMDAVSRGARSEGGLTIGILPDYDTQHMSAGVDIPIITGLGQARNVINVLSSSVVVACGMGPGTASEIALAIKFKKPVILLDCNPIDSRFFNKLDSELVHSVQNIDDVIVRIKDLI